jgi:antitoxin VapB
MPLYIKGETTTQMVGELARKRGSTKQHAVKFAVQAELDRITPEPTLREKLQQFRAEHPLPPPTGEVADKAFFDDLSGET